MTVSTIEIQASRDDVRISRLAVSAIALSVAEAAIPLPLPGVKPGLANIVILLVLLRWGWRDAAWVAMLRVFAGSLLLGQLFAPGFFLSLVGALASLGVLALVCHLPQRWFGPVSLSVCAAWAHIAGQLLVVRLWLIPDDGVLYLLPVLALAATLFGVVNGLVAGYVLKHAWPDGAGGRDSRAS
jgi:heptaprenyl diphosphate synthase